MSNKAFWRELNYSIESEAAFCTLFGNSTAAFWLDGSLVHPEQSRWSYMGDISGPNAALVQYHCPSQLLEINDQHGKHLEHQSIFNYLKEMLPAELLSPPPCPFIGGYVGWLGYELRNECGSATTRQASTPDALLILSDRFIAIDHLEKRTLIIAIDESNQANRANKWIAETIAHLDNLTSPVTISKNVNLPIQFVLNRDHASYLSDIEQCLNWIRKGETYQICLTNEICCSACVDPMSLYKVMRQINPAPYAALIKYPGGMVLSASPECFLSVDASRNICTKPIKGTISRHSDVSCDEILARNLYMSEKDRAENIMIVDLLRNDLSRVCEPGSVVVPKLFAIESYATVHQLVSTVTGVLRADFSIIDLLKSAFPGGSMAGVTKIRTMKLIDLPEQRPRGMYSGTLGWLGHNGAMELSMVIRTIVYRNGLFSMGSGGGIVVQSTPEGEFTEMLLKAQASIQAIVMAATGTFRNDYFQIVGANE